MESQKIAFFCWESLYAERVGGLACAATNLAETLAKNHEMHYFTRGSMPDQTINNVHYHYCRPSGNNPVEYCDTMSNAMVEQFHQQDAGDRFDVLHFHDWHPIQALHHLQERETILTFHSTEYGRNGNQYGNWEEFRQVSGKEWYGGLIAKRITTVSSTLKNEIMHLYNVPDWKCDVVPNGIMPRQYRADIDAGAVKQAYGIHPYAPLILFVGRLAYQKGPDIFIDAIRKVCEHRWDARVIVAGDGGMRAYLQGRAHNLPDRKSVV
jgi:glycogen synthase